MSAEEVKKIREATGAGIMDCQQALIEAGGDFEKALEIIRKKGLAKADKKISRHQTSVGFISFIISKVLGVIHKKKLAKVDRKISSQQASSAGLIISYIHHNDKLGVLLEIHCQTDFVAKLDDFKELGKQIAMQIAAADPQNVEELMKQPYIKDESVIIGDLIKGLIAKTGENIQVYRFCRYAL